jgi:murein DD-endopeptidase MepM/ murein hydrolase activator NlpD
MKHEIRSMKLETSTKSEIRKKGLGLRFSDLKICFGFRISDFGFRRLLIVFLILAVVLVPVVQPVQADLLTDKANQLRDIQKKITEQQKVLDATRSRKATLQNQLASLDEQIKLSELQLESINANIEKITADMDQLNGQLVDAEVQIFENKKVLREAIKEVYMRQRVGVLEVLVGSTNLSDFMSQVEYITTIQGRITNSITVMRKLNDALKDQKVKLEKADIEIKQLQSSKQLEQQSLDSQQNSKQGLLQDATLTEAEYQRRIRESALEEAAIQAEIAQLTSNLTKNTLVPPGKLLWPIPARKVSAYFRDPDYFKIFKVWHSAIDVPTPQATPIRAPANAFVEKVRDAGKGYSYIVLNHGDGLATVYGHVSRIMVGQGQFIPLGAVIGLSGGLPGGDGSGWMTTGAHLHFEVWKNGAAQNPMNYLVG